MTDSTEESHNPIVTKNSSVKSNQVMPEPENPPQENGNNNGADGDNNAVVVHADADAVNPTAGASTEEKHAGQKNGELASNPDKLGRDEEEKPPGCFIMFVSHRPYLMLLISFSIALIMAVIPAVMGINVFASTEGGRFDAYKDFSSRQFFAQLELQQPKELTACPKKQDQLVAQSVKAVGLHPNIIVFHKDIGGENLLTNEKLTQIMEYEQSMIDLGKGDDDEDAFVNYCLLVNGECSRTSVVDPFLLDNGKIQSDAQIQKTIKTLQKNPGNPNFDKNFLSTGESVYAASFFDLGRPLTNIDATFCDPNFELDQQDKLWEDFLATHYSSFFKDGRSDTTRVGFLANGLIQLDFGELIQKDITLVMVSIFLVLGVLIVHTRSSFLSCMGILHIFLSFPAAAFIYRVIFQFEIYPGLNIMALFIIYGIGADDIFVMVDAWRQSAHQPLGPSLSRRLQWAWKRAASAMFITSFTTFMAFVATATSPVPTIQVFGIFSASVILCNYLLCITWFAAVLVVYHINGWDENGCNFCCKAQKRNYSRKDDTRIPSRAINAVEMKPLVTEGPAAAPPQPAPPGQAIDDDDVSTYKATGMMTAEEELGDISRYGKVEQFYHSKLFPWVLKARVGILIVTFFVVVAGIVGASFLSVAQVNEINIPASINSGRAIHWLVNEFPASGSDTSQPMEVVVGLQEPFLDTSGVDPNANDNPGTVVYNPDFDLSDPKMQQFVYDLCVEASDTLATANEEGECVMRGFRTWAQANDGFPVAAKDFVDDMATYLEAEPADRTRIDYASISSGALPRWIILSFPSEASYTDNDQRDRTNKAWLDFAKAQNDRLAAEGLEQNSGIFVAGGSIVNERTVKLLAQSTFQSVGLSILIAFVALVVATDDFAVAGLAIVNIGGVVSCTIGLIVSFGWSLDVIESICITILVGVSVDFIVHFAHAYADSESRKRVDKALVAWTHLGISVLFGAITTLLATAPLFATTFNFFTKFGTFLFLAISIALAFSHLPFLAMLTLVGPESQRFKPSVYLKKLHRKWQQRKA